MKHILAAVLLALASPALAQVSRTSPPPVEAPSASYNAPFLVVESDGTLRLSPGATLSVDKQMVVGASWLDYHVGFLVVRIDGKPFAVPLFALKQGNPFERGGQ